MLLSKACSISDKSFNTFSRYPGLLYFGSTRNGIFLSGNVGLFHNTSSDLGSNFIVEPNRSISGILITPVGVL